MNRKKPQPRYAVLPVRPGENLEASVFRKSALHAIASLHEQTMDNCFGRSMPFVAGYVLGYGRQVALKHGVNSEAGLMHVLIAEIMCQLPAASGIDLSSMEFSLDDSAARTSRSRLVFPARSALAESGYLVGQLEALCGTSELLRKALVHLGNGQHSGTDFITECDNAADPMQTRMPTASLRFNAFERAVILKAFTEISE